jgi:type IV secretory pathway VirB9-like protein
MSRRPSAAHPLTTRIRYTTMVVRFDDEDIADVVCGDKDYYDRGRRTSRTSSRREKAATNLNLVTTRGRCIRSC